MQISEIVSGLNLVYAPIIKANLNHILFRVECIEIWSESSHQKEEIQKLKKEINEQLNYINSKINEEQAS